jgi:hypothetical protein
MFLGLCFFHRPPAGMGLCGRFYTNDGGITRWRARSVGITSRSSNQCEQVESHEVSDFISLAGVLVCSRDTGAYGMPISS